MKQYRARRTLYTLLAVIVVMAAFCACKKKPLTAPQQAEVYYSMLLHGQYEDFVRASYGCDSLPPDYLSQRVDLLAQHVETEQRAHGGYDRFSAVGDKLLSDSTHLVYLEVVFRDSTRAQIACPMIWKGERWLMRN